MKVIETLITNGPSCWSVDHHQLLVMTVDEEAPLSGSSCDIRKLKSSHLLMDDTEWLQEQETMRSRKGIEKPGYFLGMVISNLQRRVGVDCSYFSTSPGDRPSRVRVIVEYRNERVGLIAAGIAIEIVGAVLRNQEYDVSPGLHLLQQKLVNSDNEQLTAMVVKEAMARKIPCMPLRARAIMQLGYGIRQKRIGGTVTDATSSFGVKIAGNKEATKVLLRSLGIPVPMGKLIFRVEALATAIKEIGFPMVVKPVGGNNGRGVSVNIRTYEQAVRAFRMARETTAAGDIVVEKYIHGYDYRLLVVNYKFIAAVKRTPAMVLGDGRSTIAQLVHLVNQDPRRGVGHKKPLTFITIDDVTKDILSAQGMSEDTVLPKGKELFLKSIANISMGGTSTDVTERVPPENVFMAERIARIVGLDVCGMDVITPDIEVPLLKNGGAVVEVNSGPGLRLHMEPSYGKPRNVAGAIVDMLFPESGSWRIPIVAVVGGHAAGDRIAAVLEAAGHRVGRATSTGTFIQGLQLTREDSRSYTQAEMVLKDPTIDAAVFECGISEIQETGTAFDYCEIGIVLETGNLGRKAAVIPRIVLASGYAILNAGDDCARGMGQDLACKVGYVSLEEDDPFVIRHLENGGSAAVVAGGAIVLCKGHEKWQIIGHGEMADGKKARLDMLACVLVGWIYGVATEAIRTAVLGQ